MSFDSRAWSNESFERGLELAHSASLDVHNDPEPTEVLAELERLQDRFDWKLQALRLHLSFVFFAIFRSWKLNS